MYAGGENRTVGGFVFVYPTPGSVIATPVTVPPALIVTEPNALEEEVYQKLTVAVEYPTPPSEITTEEIVPSPDTTAVPAAPVFSS